MFVSTEQTNQIYNPVHLFIHHDVTREAVHTNVKPHSSNLIHSSSCERNSSLNRPAAVISAARSYEKKIELVKTNLYGVNKCMTQIRKARNENLMWRLNGKQFVMVVP